MSTAARGRRLSVKEAAAHLQLPLGTLYDLIAKRRIPFYELRTVRSRRLWLYELEIEAWLEAHRMPARAKDEPRLQAPEPEPVPLGIQDLLPRKRVFG